jgi:hypothetical protein
MGLTQTSGRVLTAVCNYAWMDNRGHRAEVKKGQQIGKLKLYQPKRWLGRGVRGEQIFVLGGGGEVDVRWDATEGWGWFEAVLGKGASSEGYFRQKNVWVPKMAEVECRARTASCGWDDRRNWAAVWYKGPEQHRIVTISMAMLTALLTEKAGWLHWTDATR